MTIFNGTVKKKDCFMVRARLKREKNLFDTWSRRRKENITM